MVEYSLRKHVNIYQDEEHNAIDILIESLDILFRNKGIFHSGIYSLQTNSSEVYTKLICTYELARSERDTDVAVEIRFILHKDINFYVHDKIRAGCIK